MKGRIIIDFEGEYIDEGEAIAKVLRVVCGGRVSEAGGVKHFCWATVFPGRNGIVVQTRRKKVGQQSDSFMVYRK